MGVKAQRAEDASTHDYYDRAISYGSLRKALSRCCRNVRWKDSTVGYELHAARNTYRLRQDLLKGTYRISPYQKFQIHEPKEREIIATRIRDRQIQMALCQNGLYDDITEHFITDNCACQIGRGTDYAIKRLRKHMADYYRECGNEGWVLKCDIRKFFPSTPHRTAKAAIAKRVADERARKMVFDVIDSFEGEKGIGLGSQISQLVELAVLDDMDHMIKEQLRVKHYVRYMDDFVLIHEDREFLGQCLEVIRNHVEGIGLELNAKTCMFPLKQGIRFLKWHLYIRKTGKIIQKMDKSKMGRQRRKIRKLLRKEACGEVRPGTAEESMKCWIANARKGNTWKQQERMWDYYRRTKEETEYDYQRDADPEERTRCLVGRGESREERSHPGIRGHDGGRGTAGRRRGYGGK